MIASVSVQDSDARARPRSHATHPNRGMTSISTSCGGTGSSERRPGSSSRPAVLLGMPARPGAAEGHLITGHHAGGGNPATWRLQPAGTGPHRWSADQGTCCSRLRPAALHRGLHQVRQGPIDRSLTGRGTTGVAGSGVQAAHEQTAAHRATANWQRFGWFAATHSASFRLSWWISFADL